MAHAKPTDLEDISQLLSQIRSFEQLKEKSTGCFYLKSKSVLHFHVKGERRFAHGSDWQEVNIVKSPSSALQKKILKAIHTLLPLA